MITVLHDLLDAAVNFEMFFSNDIRRKSIGG